MSSRSIRVNSIFASAFAAAASLAAVAALSGCGVASSSTSPTPFAAMGGAVHGGQSPIQGATVNLYVTNPAATGYGQAGTMIGTATTDAGGNFTIDNPATPANCPAGQQAYITAAGGYPSGQPSLTNTSVLMMAALGDCVNVNANTHVIINELSTVAAGYALSGFMTTSAGTGGLFTANVSAPAANSAATGSTTAAAGLPHAFVNATALVDWSSGNTHPTTAPATVGTATVSGVVPVALVNTLGNILQSCVNSATGSQLCNSLFSFTPSISGTAPANTLQAMINLARNPYPSTAAMTAATGLFSLASAQPSFLPTLTAQPPDWSISVVWRQSGTLPVPYNVGLDANDTAYFGSTSSAVIAGISAYGVPTPSFTAGTGTATRQVAPDAKGNVWVGNNSTLLLQYSASAGGAATTYTFPTGSEVAGIAVDKNNNIWVGSASSPGDNVFELAYPNYTVNYTSTAPGSFQPVNMAVDANQNIWEVNYFTGGSMAAVLPNLSAATPASTPTYTTTGTEVTPISATFASSATKPLGVVLDASGNAWYGITGSNSQTTTGIEEVIPSITSSVITSLNPQPLITGTTLGARASQSPGIDGSGVIYIPDNNSTSVSGIHIYSTQTVASSNTGGQVLSPPGSIYGCYLSTAATTTCGAQGSTAAIYNPRNVVVDSTGAVWTGSTSGGVVQTIGLGAPTWPLLAVGHPGVSPGNTTVTPLP